MVPGVVQGVWDSGGMVSAGKGGLQSPAGIPKLAGPHKPECHYVGRPDSMLTANSWYVTQSQGRGEKGDLRILQLLGSTGHFLAQV